MVMEERRGGVVMKEEEVVGRARDAWQKDGKEKAGLTERG